MADLGPAGQAFFEALSSSVKKHPDATRVLIREAARAVDRLEDIDDIIGGKDVLELLRFRLRDNEGNVAEVKFDAILTEARQQQANLGNLLKVILPNLDESAGAVKERDVLDEIAQRRAARGAGTGSGPVRSRRVE